MLLVLLIDFLTMLNFHLLDIFLSELTFNYLRILEEFTVSLCKCSSFTILEHPVEELAGSHFCAWSSYVPKIRSYNWESKVHDS